MHLNYSLHTLLQVTKTQRMLFYIEQMLRKLYTMNLNPHGVIAEHYHCVVLCVAKKKLIRGNAIRDSTLINHSR